MKLKSLLYPVLYLLLMLMLILMVTPLLTGCQSSTTADTLSLTPSATAPPARESNLIQNVKLTGKDDMSSAKRFLPDFDASYSSQQIGEQDFENNGQISVDDNYIRWGTFHGLIFVSVYKSVDSEVQPLYFNFFGKQLDSLQVLEDKAGSGFIRLIEVKGYGASGSSQTGIVHLLGIKGTKVTEVWKHDFIILDTNANNITSITRSYYSLLPGKYYTGLDNTSISVFNTTELIKRDEAGKVLSSISKPSAYEQYLWNDKSESFVLTP